MSKKIVHVMILLAALTMVGCSSLSWAQEEPVVEFKIAMQVNSAQEFHVSLGVHNAGRGTFEGDNSFNGQMDVRRIPSGELRASAHVVPIQALEPGETAWPIGWRGHLEAGTYELTWGAEGYGETVETFSIVEQDGRLYFRGQPLATLEPEASKEDERDSLVSQAIADLRHRLDVPVEEIEVANVEETTFSDTSLGVPRPGKTYAPMVVQGYVIRLRVDDELYEYHGGSGYVVFVPRGQEGTEEGPVNDTAGHQKVTVPEVGLTFAVPADWQRVQPEYLWTPEAGSDLQLGVKGRLLDPPMEPEAVLLPNHAQVLESAPVDVGWAAGRRFRLEVYAPAAEGGDTKTPVESVETHVLLTVARGEERLGINFYSSAPSEAGLEELEPLLQDVLESARLTEAPQTSLPPVDEAEVAQWHVLTDEVYGFRIHYPPDWTCKEMRTDGPGTPEDWPLERSVAFFPQAWAERFEQSGPPDPDAPPAVPVPRLDVYVGSEEEFRRAVMEPTVSESLEVNGIEATREVEAVGENYQIISYVFEHPDREEVRIVLVDALTGFEDRLKGNRDVAGMLSKIVATFDFLD